MGYKPVLVEGVRTAGTVCVRDSMVLYTGNQTFKRI